MLYKYLKKNYIKSCALFDTLVYHRDDFVKKKKKGEEEKINHCLAISNSKIMTFTYILVADCTLLLT